MISFASLSALVRALWAMWALLLCLTNLGSAVLATVRKRYSFTALALVLYAPLYFLWQVIFDLSLRSKTGAEAPVSTVLGGQAWVYWLLVYLLLTAASALLFGFNLHYDKAFITPGTIKLYLDQIPCGICCWRDNGRVLFSNICMNTLCVAITGHPLLNGNQFYEQVQDGILRVNNQVWRFARREMNVDSERLYEMIGTDITTEYAKTAALEKDKAELSRLKNELWAYYLNIDRSVQRQEMLQAKMNIHDEMNRLMLSTVAADIEDTAALDRIFSLWEQNALLLCMEADRKNAGRESDALDSLANALNVQLVWQNALPDTLDDSKKELFFFAAQEAMVNAVKHAQATTMTITFEESDTALYCRFTNDGRLPVQGGVKFAGGLANIALLAEEQGASVMTETGDAFTLVLRFEKNT